MRIRPRQSFLLIGLIAVLSIASGFAAYRHLHEPLVHSVSDETKSVSEAVKSLSSHVTQAVTIRLAQRDITSAFHKRRLNFVILGTQEDEGTTDSIILAHVDLDRRLATLISIPRDSWVLIPGHGFQKINAAYAFGGAKLAGQVVATVLGAHVDATIAVDPVGAKQIVDAMGGLNINVEHDMGYDCHR